MNQVQIQGFLNYAKEHVPKYNTKKCEGSDHVHIGDELIGGFSKTRQEFFIIDCEVSEGIILSMQEEDEPEDDEYN